jgi:hypothetical protein
VSGPLSPSPRRGSCGRGRSGWAGEHADVGDDQFGVRLLGLDDARLTYFHGGRFRQLSQFGGQVIRELIA